MKQISKGKRECYFTVTTKVFLLFKSICSSNGKRMNIVIEELMLLYVNDHKNDPPH